MEKINDVNSIIDNWKNNPAFNEIEEDKLEQLLLKVVNLLERAGYTKEEMCNNIMFKTGSTRYEEPYIQVYNGTYPLGQVFISINGNVHYENWKDYDPKQIKHGGIPDRVFKDMDER